MPGAVSKIPAAAFAFPSLFSPSLIHHAGHVMIGEKVRVILLWEISDGGLKKKTD